MHFTSPQTSEERKKNPLLIPPSPQKILSEELIFQPSSSSIESINPPLPLSLSLSLSLFHFSYSIRFDYFTHTYIHTYIHI